MNAYSTTRRSAPLFFVLAFALTWSCWVPWAIWMQSQAEPATASPMMLLNLLGTFGPAAAALLLTAALAGRRAVGALLGRLRQWRVGAVWYAVALLGCPLLLAAALLLERALGDGVHIAWNGLLPQLVVALVVSLGEEIGWRGYALPELLRRRCALSASLVLGAAWTAWHMPVYFAVVDTGGVALALDLAFYAANITAAAVLFTWLWLHTRGSLLPVVLLHIVFNALNTTALVASGDTQLGRIVTLLLCAAAAAVVAGDRARMLEAPVPRPTGRPATAANSMPL